jgi:GR25 family glycosyltransferase involved in LPS biosynthesis
MTVEELARTVPVWAISLKRATERRASIAKQLKDAGIDNYEIVDAVDGKDPSAVTYKEAKKYMWGKPLRRWIKGDPWARVRLAGDLSHYRLLERAKATNTTAIILEDDAVFEKRSSKGFYSDLLAAMQELPNDWMVLYLNACYHVVGQAIGPHVAVFRAGACIWGYVVTPEFATVALDYVHKPQPEGYTVVDLLFDHTIQEHHVQAYIAQPALVGINGDNSLVPDNKPREQSFNLWDRMWLLWNRHRKLL